MGTILNASRGQPSGTAIHRSLQAAAILLSLLAVVLPTGSAQAAAPANSVIGNQATATYQDATGTTRTATSNLVQTTVAQVGAYTLVAGQSKTVAPGSTVYYPHTLTNTGNGADTFTLSAIDANTGGIAFTNLVIYADANGDGVPDNATPITSTGALAAGEQFRFVIAATVPGTVSAGTNETITVSGGTGGFGATAQTNTDTATASGNAVIGVVKSFSVQQGAASGTACVTPFSDTSCRNVVVTLTYTNTGSNTASNVTFTDVIGSSGAIAGTPYNTNGMAYVPGTASWSGGGALTDAALGDPTGISYEAATAGAVTTITATLAAVAPGQSGTISFQANIRPTAPVGTSQTSNAASFTYNDGATTVAATATNVATYNVAPVRSVVLDDQNPTTPAQTAGSVQSTTDNGVFGNDVIQRSANVVQGAVVAFENIVTNTGTVTDTFNMSVTANPIPGAVVTFYNATNSAPLTDTNGDGIADTGPVAAGLSARVWMRVQLPPNYTSSAAIDFVKRATSVGNPNQFDATTDRIPGIDRRTVDLTNDASVSGGAQAADGLGFQATGEASPVRTTAVNPGTSASFSLWINNTSPVADNYDLIATTAQAGINSATPTVNLPAGWTVTFRLPGSGSCTAGTANGALITNTGNVPANGAVQVCASVAVPSGAAAGNTEIYFRAASPAAAQYNNTAPSQYAGFDVKHDRVSVNAVANLTLVPNKSGQVFPGGNVLYSHQLCNNGNTPISGISFPPAGNVDSGAATGWTHVLYQDSNGNGIYDPGTDTVVVPGTTTDNHNAGACLFLFNMVFAPLGATSGQANNTTITANSTAGNPSVTDVTVVVSGDVSITKEQQTIDCTSGIGVGPQASYTANNIGTALQPGTCVKYRITASNTGSAPVTNLIVTDAVPTYTVLSTATGCITAPSTNSTITPAAAAAAGLVGSATPGGTGTVTTRSDGYTLPAGGQVTLEFCIRINP